VAAAAETAGTRERVSFGVNADRFVPIDNLALDPIALAAVMGAAWFSLA
jgi:hypothetical protein